MPTWNSTHPLFDTFTRLVAFAIILFWLLGGSAVLILFDATVFSYVPETIRSWQDHDPDALSRPTLASRALLDILRLVPFHCALAGGWWWYFKRHQPEHQLPMRLFAGQWHVRRHYGQPVAVALIVCAAVSVLANWGLSALEANRNLAMLVMTLLALLSVTILAHWHTTASAISDPPCLIIDTHLQTLSWPAKATGESALSISASQLRSLEITDAVTTSASESVAPEFTVQLTFLNDGGLPETRSALTTHRGIEARRLADWLESWAGLPASKCGLVS